MLPQRLSTNEVDSSASFFSSASSIFRSSSLGASTSTYSSSTGAGAASSTIGSGSGSGTTAQAGSHATIDTSSLASLSNLAASLAVGGVLIPLIAAMTSPGTKSLEANKLSSVSLDTVRMGESPFCFMTTPQRASGLRLVAVATIPVVTTVTSPTPASPKRPAASLGDLPVTSTPSTVKTRRPGTMEVEENKPPSLTEATVKGASLVRLEKEMPTFESASCL
mmetsp:Transcript_31124/g.51401  ORF Transcript_31124/g.51401 Transcript_31124/m.51401 type:complete len:222 (-) Transcript_31124:125-790(-)